MKSLLVGVAVLGAISNADADGTISSFSHAELEAAIASGGLVTFAADGTVTLTNTIRVEKDTVLQAGPHAVTITGAGMVRLFSVGTNVHFRIEGVCLADGRVQGRSGSPANPPEPGERAFGAAILNDAGEISLVDCTITNHYVRGGNAGEDTARSLGGRGGDALGAAIWSRRGILNLTNCVFSGNRAEGGLGSYQEFGPGNISGAALGGAVYSEADRLNLDRVKLVRNSAAGGAVVVGANPTAGSAGKGGDAFGGALYCTNSVVAASETQAADNRALGGPPTVFFVSGSGSGSAYGAALCLASNTVGEITSSVFTNNLAIGAMGERNDTGGNGAGGAIFNSGTLLVVDSTFWTNRTEGGTSRYPGFARGGAVASSGALALSGCTFAYNVADAGDSALEQNVAAEGGGVFSSGALFVTNSTFAANHAEGGVPVPTYPGIQEGGPGRGGAIAITGGTCFLVNDTIAGNGAQGGRIGDAAGAGASQGGGLFATNSVVTLRNTIIADSSAGGDIWGQIADGGYNLVSDGTGALSAPGSLNNADPLLSALTDNGGPTLTVSLLVGSPARDAIPSGFPAADQRGTVRPQGTAADIGALEAEPVMSLPTIVNQPEDQSVRAGRDVEFTVAAAGDRPLSYQWKRDGAPLLSGTSPKLSITNVQADDAGIYLVVVSNGTGSVTSRGAVLTVDSMPLIVSNPQSIEVSPGSAAMLSVGSEGPALSYQWLHDGALLAGATDSALTISSAAAGAQGGYSVIVTNFAGSVTSAVAVLTFDASALSILVSPTNVTVESGNPAAFGVTVSGVPPFAYQWLRNGSAVTGATQSTFSIPSADFADAGDYSVVITNGYGSVASLSGHLTVTAGAPRPVLVLNRAGQNVTITFSAEAGRSYRLLTSSNLVQWSVAGTATAATAGQLQFVKPVGNGGAVFYRVATP